MGRAKLFFVPIPGIPSWPSLCDPVTSRHCQLPWCMGLFFQTKPKSEMLGGTNQKGCCLLSVFPWFNARFLGPIPKGK